MSPGTAVRMSAVDGIRCTIHSVPDIAPDPAPQFNTPMAYGEVGAVSEVQTWEEALSVRATGTPASPAAAIPESNAGSCRLVTTTTLELPPRPPLATDRAATGLADPMLYGEVDAVSKVPTWEEAPAVPANDASANLAAAMPEGNAGSHRLVTTTTLETPPLPPLATDRAATGLADPMMHGVEGAVSEVSTWEEAPSVPASDASANLAAAMPESNAGSRRLVTTTTLETPPLPPPTTDRAATGLADTMMYDEVGAVSEVPTLEEVPSVPASDIPANLAAAIPEGNAGSRRLVTTTTLETPPRPPLATDRAAISIAALVTYDEGSVVSEVPTWEEALSVPASDAPANIAAAIPEGNAVSRRLVTTSTLETSPLQPLAADRTAADMAAPMAYSEVDTVSDVPTEVEAPSVPACNAPSNPAADMLEGSVGNCRLVTTAALETRQLPHLATDQAATDMAAFMAYGKVGAVSDVQTRVEALSVPAREINFCDSAGIHVCTTPRRNESNTVMNPELPENRHKNEEELFSEILQHMGAAKVPPACISPITSPIHSYQNSTPEEQTSEAPNAVQAPLNSVHCSTAPQHGVQKQSVAADLVVMHYVHPWLEHDVVYVPLPAAPVLRCPACPSEHPFRANRDNPEKRTKDLEAHLWEEHLHSVKYPCMGCKKVLSRYGHASCPSMNGVRWNTSKTITVEWKNPKPKTIMHPDGSVTTMHNNATIDNNGRWLLPFPVPRCVECPACDKPVGTADSQKKRRDAFLRHVKKIHFANVNHVCLGCSKVVSDLSAHYSTCAQVQNVEPPGIPTRPLPATCRVCNMRFPRCKLATKHAVIHRREEARRTAEAHNPPKARTQLEKRKRIARILDIPEDRRKNQQPGNQVNQIHQPIDHQTKSKRVNVIDASPRNATRTRVFINKKFQHLTSIVRTTPNKELAKREEAGPTAEAHNPTKSRTQVENRKRIASTIDIPDQHKNQQPGNQVNQINQPNVHQTKSRGVSVTDANLENATSTRVFVNKKFRHLTFIARTTPNGELANHRATHEDTALDPQHNIRNTQEEEPEMGLQEPTSMTCTFKKQQREQVVHIQEPTPSTSMTRNNQQIGTNHGLPRTRNCPTDRTPDDEEDEQLFQQLFAIGDSLRRLGNTQQGRGAQVELNDLYEQMVGCIQKIVKLPPMKERTRTKKENTTEMTPSYIRQLFKRNPRQAIRTITKTSSSHCEIAPSVLDEYFRPILTIPPAHETPAEATTSANVPEVNTNPFTSGEVARRLGKAENTAPGRDRLTYAHLKSVDPECEHITHLMNAVLALGRIPDEWRKSRTCLIHKKGDKENPANWRPITLMPTLYKLYTGLLAQRISNWAESNQIFYDKQKGFRPFDGVLEHNFAIDTHITKAVGQRKPICIALLDLTNAFGSVPHEVLLAATAKAGVGEKMNKIIEDLYKDTTTCILGQTESTPPIPVKCGVRQGCPMSGLLFNLVINDHLNIDEREDDSDDSDALAYADDITIVSSSPEKLQQRISKMCDALKAKGIHINNSKCKTVHIEGSSVLPTQFYANNQKIPTMEYAEETEYLGSPVGFQAVPTWKDTKTAQKIAEDIANSDLLPWQKLQALKKYVAPSLIFPLRMGTYKKSHVKTLDGILRPPLKRILNLPERATGHYLYATRKVGAIEFPEFTSELDIWAIDSGYKILTSKDQSIQKLATNTLRDEAAHCLKRQEITQNEMGEYLSGEHTPRNARASSWWTRTRQSSARLGVVWTFEEDGKPTLHFNNNSQEQQPADDDPGQDEGAQNGDDIPEEETRPETTSINNITAKSRHLLVRKLRERARTKHADSWKKCCRQGMFSKSLEAQGKTSTKFIDSGKFCDTITWNFIHKARLNIASELRATEWTNSDITAQACRYRCEDTQGQVCRESLGHVLSVCKHNGTQRTLRHNKIVAILEEAARNNKHTIIGASKAYGPDQLRPDLILEKGNTITIVEVTCANAWDEMTLDNRRKHKEEKYLSLHPIFLAKGYDTVKTSIICVGALGEWDKGNKNALLNITTSAAKTRAITEVIIAETIRGSRSIFHRHIGNEHLVAPEYSRTGTGAATAYLHPATRKAICRGH